MIYYFKQFRFPTARQEDERIAAMCTSFVKRHVPLELRPSIVCIPWILRLSQYYEEATSVVNLPY